MGKKEQAWFNRDADGNFREGRRGQAWGLNRFADRRKGQAWGYDLMIAVAIFAAGLVVFYFYGVNSSITGRATIDSLTYDGESLSDMLLGEGYPTDWDSSNVQKIGLMSGGQIDPSKVEEFYSMSDADYERTKNIFETRSEYFITFSRPIGEFEIENVGKNFEGSDPEDLVKISRAAAYDNFIISIDIYIWE